MRALWPPSVGLAGTVVCGRRARRAWAAVRVSSSPGSFSAAWKSAAALRRSPSCSFSAPRANSASMLLPSDALTASPYDCSAARLSPSASYTLARR